MNRTKSGNTTLAQRITDCNDTVLNLTEMALTLGKSREAVKKMCLRGKIPAHKKNKDWIFLKSEIVNWIRN